MNILLGSKQRVCKICNKEKPLFEFAGAMPKKGISYWTRKCKGCLKEARIKEQQLNSDNKEYYLKKKLNLIKQRARELNYTFNLTLNDLLNMAVDRCPILGYKLIYNYYLDRKGVENYKSCSIDRINPNKGYELSNCRFISWRANTLKNNASLEESTKIFLDILKNSDDKEKEKLLNALNSNEELKQLYLSLADRLSEKSIEIDLKQP